MVFILMLKLSRGLKINLAKSELVLVGNVDNVDGLAGILGCGVASSPLKYRGLPLRPNLFETELLKDKALLSSIAHYPICLRISCLSSLSLCMLQTVLRSFNETSFGVY